MNINDIKDVSSRFGGGTIGHQFLRPSRQSDCIFCNRSCDTRGRRCHATIYCLGAQVVPTLRAAGRRVKAVVNLARSNACFVGKEVRAVFMITGPVGFIVILPAIGAISWIVNGSK
jgi:hypothetical protein